MSHASRLLRSAALALVLVPAGCGDANSGFAPPPGGAGGAGGPSGGGGGGGPQPTSCTGAVVHASPATPIEYGENEVAQTLAAAGSKANVCVLTANAPGASAALAAAGAALDTGPEAYAVVGSGSDTLVIGRDATGAMYGALEIAERVRLDGANVVPVTTPIVGKPSIPIRGATLYIVMQQASETAWWFRDSGFWTGYLDMLAHARMDFLDLRGMYNLTNTIFPNSLLYFGTSKSFPNVGAPAADRAQNLAMLGTIVSMASVRGIRVGFMTFRSDTSLTGNANDPGTPLSDADLQTYTREATASVASQVPGLWRFGVRIGESGHNAAWFKNSVVAGLADSGTPVKFYTRTWLSSKPEVTDLVGASGSDPLVMAKYNGEHLAAPYTIAGGSFVEQGWAPSYSYEDYLEPPTPYSFIFEVRAGGTHRLFRYASYARTQRTVASFTMGAAKGFGLEPPHAYFPQRDFYHQPSDVFATWTYRRDELFYMLFGRLAYDASTPERVFRAALQARVGTDGLWDAVQAASDVVPWIQTANTCGPDQRDFAPDLEWGGPVGYWSQPTNAPLPAHGCGRTDLVRIFHGPFDVFAVASPFDTAKDLVGGGSTSRLTPIDVANLVSDDAQRARAAATVPIDANNAEARDYVRECGDLADLGDYFAHKLRGATALAVYTATASADYLGAARSETQLADQAWTQLASDTAYISPFDDLMRAGPQYHWKNALAWLGDDPGSIDQIVAQVQATPPNFGGTLPVAATWLGAARASGPGLASLGVAPQDATASSWTVTASFQNAVPQGALVKLWAKSFDGRADWQPIAMTASGAQAQATVPGTGVGAMFIVQVSAPPGGAWRYPDVLQSTPYGVLAP